MNCAQDFEIAMQDVYISLRRELRAARERSRAPRRLSAARHHVGSYLRPIHGEHRQACARATDTARLQVPVFLPQIRIPFPQIRGCKNNLSESVKSLDNTAKLQLRWHCNGRHRMGAEAPLPKSFHRGLIDAR